ncbi:MAG: fibrinogen-like YCDxxxxGGGW domain-containing protein, partial [Bradymonadaceae bacterium]
SMDRTHIPGNRSPWLRLLHLFGTAPGDYSGNASSHCEDRNRSGNDIAYGPAWSGDNDSGCSFDDPGQRFGLGPDSNSPSTEREGRGFGWALGLNTGSSGAAENYLQLFIREPTDPWPLAPAAPGPLVLVETPVQNGDSCTAGSWNEGNIAHQGFVICSTNDASPPIRASCLDMRQSDSVSNTELGGISGIYSIHPPMSPAPEAFEVHCDMDTDGGGWTQIANVFRGPTMPSPGREFAGTSPHELRHSVDATGIHFGAAAITHHGLPDHDFASFELSASHLWDSQGVNFIFEQTNGHFTIFALPHDDDLVAAACFNSSEISCTYVSRSSTYGAVSEAGGGCRFLDVSNPTGECGAWGSPYAGDRTWTRTGGRLLIR